MNMSMRQCDPEPNALDVPRGRYEESCMGCSLANSGKLLRCTHCRSANGDRIGTHMCTHAHACACVLTRAHTESSIDLESCVPPAVLENGNGRLKCDGLPNADDVPAGGYAHSCQGFRKDE